MPHNTFYGGTIFDVYPPEFQPEGDDFMKLGDIKGEFASKHDPLTGIDTGSGNDRFMGLDTGSGNDRLTGIDTGSGNDHIVHHLGGNSGPGGSTFFTDPLGFRLINPDSFLMVNNIGSTSVPGGMNYAEAVGLDSSTVDVVNNLIDSATPVGDFI